MQRAIKITFLMIGLFFTLSIFAVTTISQFRIATTPEKVRLVFELSAPVKYVLFTLHKPDRLVIDFKNAKLGKNFDKKTRSNSLINQLRIRSSKEYLRMVMDLKRPSQAKSFLLNPIKNQSYRLVVDLTSPTLAVSAIQSDLETSKFLANLPLPKRKKSMPQQVETTPATPVVATPIATRRPIIVVIDPGHGGKDPGTTGLGGTHEKNVVLAIAKYLQQNLNQNPGFHAVLTRTGDYYIPLRGRLDLARKYKGDMFISVHADAYPEPGAVGASVFALSQRGATSEAARWLAEKENKSELIGGATLPDNDNVLRSVLIDLSQTNTISESLQIGSAILFQLGKVTALHHSRMEQAAFVVLKSPDIPSVLVETGFLSTPAQERQLRNSQYQRMLASAIAAGIKTYFMHNPPQGTVYATSI